MIASRSLALNAATKRSSSALMSARASAWAGLPNAMIVSATRIAQTVAAALLYSKVCLPKRRVSKKPPALTRRLIPVSITCPAGSAGARLQPLLQRGRVVMGLVARGEQQGDRRTGQPVEQVARGGLRRLAFEFRVIGGPECVPTGGIAVEPAAQRVARRKLLQPNRDLRLFARQPAWP